MEIIAAVIATVAVSPLVAWWIISDIVHVRMELAKTRYFNVTADCNEYVRAERRLDALDWED